MWEGLPGNQDWNWELIETVHEDLPDFLKSYFKIPGTRALKSRAFAQYFKN